MNDPDGVPGVPPLEGSAVVAPPPGASSPTLEPVPPLGFRLTRGRGFGGNGAGFGGLVVALAGVRQRRSLRLRGERDRREKAGEPHSTSTMHSISTGMPIGSEPMPTAERACLPRSPNTSTKRSEQPLITFG